MSTDIELLMLAAKAAGLYVKYQVEDHDDNLIGLKVKPYRQAGRNTSVIWNPLTNDGDALRLAVLLDLPFRRAFNGTFETGNDKSGRPIWELREPDPYTAARRAIVRAAANIGANMP